MDSSTSVKVAVRIKPLGPLESIEDAQHCINTVPGVAQIIAGTDAYFTFDNVFGENSTQLQIYDDCVADLLNAAFEGFNATILAYGQTGSGKTWTMGSGSSDMRLGGDSFGIIPRVIKSLFDIILQKEEEDANSSYKVHIQFLELYGEDIKDLLENTKTSPITIRETATGDVFVSGAREETVTSASQMLRALEDGSRHRTTASTMMNSSSSRSHAIFTVFLEHTIESTTLASSSPPDSDEIAIAAENKPDEDTVVLNYERSLLVPQTKEVRKCKFHFVDLAGSERAKRTGAQGVQMKEGIDINKGLLALGNVISALGDENKRGKVHVPYRVSKLTRILQDSLGGNSKTLMICCVSPSEANFHESLNALRYANRARNIKNKPRVNRDPALVLVADLKTLVITLATELLEVRKSNGGMSPISATSIDELELILMNNNMYKPKLSLRTPSIRNGGASFRGEDDSPLLPLNGRHSTRSSFNSGSNIPIAIQSSSLEKLASIAIIKKEHAREVAAEERKAYESAYEIKRLREKLKAANLAAVEQEDALILVKSERDFYRMKWSEGFPVEARALKGTSTMQSLFEPIVEHSVPEEDPSGEKKRATSLSAEYHKEIQALKAEISEQRKAIALRSAVHSYDITDSVLESDLSTNVARVIAETERHLLREAKRLKSINTGNNGDVSVTSVVTSIDEDNDSDASSEIVTTTDSGDNLSADAIQSHVLSNSKIEQNDLDYQRGQKVMIEEVVELEESIGLKEQLLEQLKRSQYQYEVMKAFYEKKLSDLNFEMGQKQMERQRLMDELTDLDFLARASKQEVEPSEGQKKKEKALRDQLQKKDEELRAMVMRQEELSNLSKVQNRYTAQVAKLELDVSTMRSQKVSLTKTLKDEKKKHFKLLNDKAREIDQLRRNLIKTSAEAKKLGIDKLKAEEKFKDAMQAAAVQSRRKSSDAPHRGSVPASDSTKPKAKLQRTRSLANIHIFNESDLKTKKWLDGKIGDINGREEAVASLRVQLEQQSLLLNTKESLEIERASLASSPQALYGPSGSQKTPEERAQTLEELEDRIESVEGQLKMKNRNIAAIDDKLRVDGEVYTLPETTLDTLKKTSAVTLPASHDVIRLLFMMLVGSKSLCNQRKNVISKIEASEKQLKVDLSDAEERIHSMARAHDIEQTRTANEHEEKLLSLFTHSTIGQIVAKESGIKFAESVEIIYTAGSASSDESAFEISNQNSFSTQGMSFHGRSNQSIEVEASHRLLLAAASEQCELLKERLKREDQRIRDLQGRNSELSHRNMIAREELKVKCVTINFLEDESKLFRDMANSLRAGIMTLGGATGGVILDQVKNGNKLQNDSEVHGMSDKMHTRRSGVDSDDDDEDAVEDEKILGEFINLANVISRTGSAVDKKVCPDPVIENTSTRSLLKSPLRKQSQSGSFIANNRDVLNRLTDPSGFTGAMKNAFGADLLRKRQIVQLMKQGASQALSSPLATASNTSASPSPGHSASPSANTNTNTNTKGALSASRSSNGNFKENWGRRSLPASDKMNQSSVRDNYESPKRFSTAYQSRSPPTSSGNALAVDAKRQRRISSLPLPEEIPIPKTLGHSTFKRSVEKVPQVEPERPSGRAPRRHSVSSPPVHSSNAKSYSAANMAAVSEADDNTEFPLHLKVLMDDIVDEMSKSRNLTWDQSPSLPKPLPSKLSTLYGNYMDSPGRVSDSEQDGETCHSGQDVQSYGHAVELTSSTTATDEDAAELIERSNTRIEDFYPDEEDRVSTGGYLTSHESLSPNPLLTLDNRNADSATYVNPAVYRRDSLNLPLKGQTQLPESASAKRTKFGTTSFNP